MDDQDRAPCEGDCNPFIAPCGARFCTYEDMAAHARTCHKRSTVGAADAAREPQRADSPHAVPIMGTADDAARTAVPPLPADPLDARDDKAILDRLDLAYMFGTPNERYFALYHAISLLKTLLDTKTLPRTDVVPWLREAILD